MIDRRFYPTAQLLTVNDIIDMTGIALSSHYHTLVSNTLDDIAPLDTANNTQLSCFHNIKYLPQLQQTAAAACFIKPEDAHLLPPHTVPLITPYPYRCFGIVAQFMYPNVDRHFDAFAKPIHPSAQISDHCIINHGCVIHANAQIGQGTRIGANTVIDHGVVIGDNCTIDPGCVIHANAQIGQGTHIGANTVIDHGVVIGDNCSIESSVVVKYSIIGNNVVILAGTCIGQAGFGFFMDEKGHINIPQLGRVIIEDHVEIGANVTIDRGSLKDTLIHKNCRIDNLVQIAHNVILGQGCVIVAQVGIAGSTVIGNHVIIAGQAGIAGHLTIGNRVKIAAQAGVMRNIDDNAVVAGTPAVSAQQWHRQTVVLQKLIKGKKP